EDTARCPWPNRGGGGGLRRLLLRRARAVPRPAGCPGRVRGQPPRRGPRLHLPYPAHVEPERARAVGRCQVACLQTRARKRSARLESARRSGWSSPMGSATPCPPQASISQQIAPGATAVIRNDMIAAKLPTISPPTENSSHTNTAPYWLG